MNQLFLDIETYSSVDLSKCGVYKYAESPDFKVLLFAYAFEGDEVKVIDIEHGETIPDDVIKAVVGSEVLKIAHNATFERICLSRFLGYPTGVYLSPESWRCSMVMSAYLGLPYSLGDVGKVLGFTEDKAKMKIGKELIRKFCVPNSRLIVKPTDWTDFKEYNKRDVETEIEIVRRLEKYPVPDFVWDEYHLSEEINDRGILVDIAFAEKAIETSHRTTEELTCRLQDLTGLDNPNSVMQLKNWLEAKGVSVPSLGKKELDELLTSTTGTVHEVLALRRQLSKTSVKKYEAMVNCACSDNRVRGMFMFYGANHSGRFTSRMLQLQNLPQNHIDNISDVRQKLKNGEKCSQDIISQLIRTALIPKDDCKFIVADFSAIEARVIAWLANERWRMEAFANGEDIYCASASKMFGVPVEKHGKNAGLRQKGKVAELACGYGGGVNALKAFGADKLGLSEDELQDIVTDWRNASPNIVRLWKIAENMAKVAIHRKSLCDRGKLKAEYKSGVLFLQLPSGRRLAYAKPSVGINRFGTDSILYRGIGPQRKWTQLETYSGKLTENICQAVARDVLCFAMKNLTNAGYDIVAHVHDECIIEAPVCASVSDICEIMGMTPPWAEGLILRADGYECPFYMKD